jgi:hypothetical protein
MDRQADSISWEGNMKVKRFTGVVLVLVFSLMTALAFAAGASWVVIKDNNGVCKVIEATEKTLATIAGPFKTKDEAEKAKDKECPNGLSSAVEKIKDKAKKAVDQAKADMDKAKEKAKADVKKAVGQAKADMDKAKEKAKADVEKAKEKAKEDVEKAKAIVDKAKEEAKADVEKAKGKAKEVVPSQEK